MKKVLLTLLAVIVLLGFFAAAGLAGYRVGYAQGTQATANVDAPRRELHPFDEVGPHRMPMHNFGFGRGFPRGFGHGGFPRRGFGFFFPLLLLGRIAILALIVWFIYWLFTRSGWQLTRTVQTTKTQSEPIEPEVHE